MSKQTKPEPEREPGPPPEPPEHLSERSKDLWRRLVLRRGGSIGRRVMFQAALEALDRAEQARAMVAQDGLTKTTPATGAIHLHPAVKVELEARRQFTALWSEMGLEWDSKIDGLGRVDW